MAREGLGYCPHCGALIDRSQLRDVVPAEGWELCPRCEGKGVKHGVRCTRCRGAGVVEKASG